MVQAATPAAITESFRSGMSLHTSRAIDLLKTGKPGDTISPAQMQAAVGRPCESGQSGYGNVQSAIRKVIRENGIVWEWQRTQKLWLCCNDAQKVGILGVKITRAASSIRRGIRVVQSVDAKNLTDSETKQLSVNLSLAGMMEIAGRCDTAKRLKEVDTVKQPDRDSLVKLLS